MDGGEVPKVATGFGKVLEILGKTPVSSEPGEGVLQHPAPRQNDEAPRLLKNFDLLTFNLLKNTFNLLKKVSEANEILHYTTPDRERVENALPTPWDRARGLASTTWRKSLSRRHQGAPAPSRGQGRRA
jgi:hypothetical protein